MAFRRQIIWLGALVCLTLSTLAHAASPMEYRWYSLEWLTARAELVAVGRVVPSVKNRNYKYTIEIERVLKGTLTSGFRNKEHPLRDRPVDSQLKAGEFVLVFSGVDPNLSESTGTPNAFDIVEFPPGWSEWGRNIHYYVRLHQFDSSEGPFIIQSGIATEPPHGDALIEYISAQVNRNAQLSSQVELYLIQQSDLPRQDIIIDMPLPFGGYTILTVADGHSHEWALSEAKSSFTPLRVNAARMLSCFDDSQSIASLKQLLYDPDVYFAFSNWRHPYGSGKWKMEHIDVRYEAYQGLKRKGLAPPFPIIELPSDIRIYSPTVVSWGLLGGIITVSVFAVIAISVACRFLCPQMLGILGFWSLILLAGSIFMYLRATSRIDEIAFPISRDYRLELASLPSHLRLLSLHWPDQMPPTFTSMEPSALLLEAWDPMAQNPTSSGHFNLYGFNAGRGLLESRDLTRGQYLFASIPWWPLIIVFSVLPSVRISRWIPRRNRARLGHCRNCGYDLRESPKRCPECGTEVVNKPSYRLDN